jgi:hypothetical protein
MMSFRDMSFCGSDCVNHECSRHFGEPEKAAAKRWWGGDDAPVAFMDFSANCPDYKEPTK